MPNLPSPSDSNRWRNIAISVGAAAAGIGAGFLHSCDSADGDYELPQMTLGSPVGLSGAPESEETRSEFAERFKALMDALRDRDEGATQTRTAEQIKACVEARSGVPVTCKVNPRNLQNGALAYRPMEVSCTAYDDRMMPTGMISTYIGPVCHEYEEMEGYGKCLDRDYATIVAGGKTAAFLASGGTLDAGDVYMGDAGTTSFQDVYYLEHGAYSDLFPSTRGDEFRVVEESDTLEPLVDSWSYVCDETVAGLENPTEKDQAATAQYATYLETMETLWDTMQPEDMLTKSEASFFTGVDGYDVFIPIKTGESDEPIEIIMSIAEDSGNPLITTSFFGASSAASPENDCRLFGFSLEDLKNDPSLADRLVDCSPVSEYSSATHYFEYPERYIYPH